MRHAPIITALVLSSAVAAACNGSSRNEPSGPGWNTTALHTTAPQGGTSSEPAPAPTLEEDNQPGDPATPVGTTRTTNATFDRTPNDKAGNIAAQSLAGKTIAILATDGVEEVELTEPRHDFETAGARTVLIAPNHDEIQAMNHAAKGSLLKVDLNLDQANPDNYTGLLLPGGVANPDSLRINPKAIAFVKAFVTASKPIAAICHGPWTLIEAGDVRGKTLTSWPSLKTDIENAGGQWVDKAVMDDHGLVTSRKPEDIPWFSRQAIVEFGKP